MRRLFWALCFSNILFMREWRTFTYPNLIANAYHPDFLTGLFTLLVIVSLGAYLLWPLVYVLTSHWKIAYRVVALFLFAAIFTPALKAEWAALGWGSQIYFLSYGFWARKLGSNIVLILGFAGSLLLCFLVLKGSDYYPLVHRMLRRALVGCLLIIWIQLPIGILTGFYRLNQVREFSVDGRPATNRVVILYFDEWSKNFEKDVPGVEMPNLARFQSESLEMTRAISPGEITKESIPASLEGQTNEATAYFLPKNRESLFSDAKAKGKMTALVGWHVPYCLQYGYGIDRCIRLSAFWYGYENSILKSAKLYLERNFGVGKDVTISNFEEILSEARAGVVDPKLDLFLVHWNIPHLPGLLSRDLKVFGYSPDYMGRNGFSANLHLADEVLGDLRKRMEASGQWDRTTVILLSDHGVHHYRSWLPISKHTKKHVPFFIKFPGQKSAEKFDSEFQTLQLRNLTGGLLSGEVTSPEGLRRWLQHSLHSGLLSS